MADTKISALTGKTTPIAADTSVIVDSVGGANKSILLGNLPLTGNRELKALATGLLKNTTTTGTPSIAVAADLPSGIDATKIADGSVTNTEFQYIGTLSSNAQTQISDANNLAAAALPRSAGSVLTTGTILTIGASAPIVLTGALVGSAVDLSTNYTATGYNVTGQTVAMPAVTNVGAGTYAYKAIAVTAGALIQNTLAGVNTWTGLDITMPNKTVTTGSIGIVGLKITKTTATPDHFIYMDSSNNWTGAGLLSCINLATTGQNYFYKSNQGATPNIGVGLINGTAAVGGVPVQAAPSLNFSGQVWNTTVTAAKNYYDFTIDSLPVSGTAPTAGLKFNYNLAATANTTYNELMRLDAVSATAGNLLVGLTASPTSLAKGFALGSGTAASAVAANSAAMWVEDVNAAAGYAGWHKMTETTAQKEIVPGVIIKTDTGSPANPYEGVIEINTYDNKVRMYADAGWRELGTW